tara:strand:- start:274 stop:744 length:471 start_codon:yes stop_codon:yes gene_type:complete
MEITDRIYLLMEHKEYRGSTPREIGELKVLNNDSLITLNYWGDYTKDYASMMFFAHADGYFEITNERKFPREQLAIDPDARFFKKKLRLIKRISTFKIYGEDFYPLELPEGLLKEEIFSEILIDRYKNTISFSVRYSDDRPVYRVSGILKKVTIFN